MGSKSPVLWILRGPSFIFRTSLSLTMRIPCFYKVDGAVTAPQQRGQQVVCPVHTPRSCRLCPQDPARRYPKKRRLAHVLRRRQEQPERLARGERDSGRQQQQRVLRRREVLRRPDLHHRQSAGVSRGGEGADRVEQDLRRGDADAGQAGDAHRQVLVRHPPRDLPRQVQVGQAGRGGGEVPGAAEEVAGLLPHDHVEDTAGKSSSNF